MFNLITEQNTTTIVEFGSRRLDDFSSIKNRSVVTPIVRWNKNNNWWIRPTDFVLSLQSLIWSLKKDNGRCHCGAFLDSNLNSSATILLCSPVTFDLCADHNNLIRLTFFLTLDSNLFCLYLIITSPKQVLPLVVITKESTRGWILQDKFPIQLFFRGSVISICLNYKLIHPRIFVINFLIKTWSPGS